MPKSSRARSILALTGLSLTVLFLRAIKKDSVKLFSTQEGLSSPKNFKLYCRQFPEIATKHIDEEDYPFIRYKNMTSPIMYGKDTSGRELLAFKVKITVPPTHSQDCASLTLDKGFTATTKFVLILFQRYVEEPAYYTFSFSDNDPPSHKPFARGESIFTTPHHKADETVRSKVLELIDKGQFTHNDHIYALDKDPPSVLND